MFACAFAAAVPDTAFPVEEIYFIVNDEIITKIDYDEHAKYYLESARTGVTGTDAANKKISKEEIISNMITTSLIRWEAMKSGISVDGVDVTNRINRLARMNKLKDIDALIQVLPSLGMNYEYYFKLQKNQIFSEELIQRLITVSEPTAADVEDYYLKNKDTKFLIKGRLFRLSRILIQASEESGFIEFRTLKKKAEKAYEEILAGLSFEEAVIKFSEDASSKSINGDIGYIFPDEFEGDAEVLSVLAAAKAGDITPVARSQEGFNIFKITELLTSGYVPFQKAQRLIKHTIVMEKKMAALEERLKKVRNNSVIIKKTDYFGNYEFK